jgi:hypothetical protein
MKKILIIGVPLGLLIVFGLLFYGYMFLFDLSFEQVGEKVYGILFGFAAVSVVVLAGTYLLHKPLFRKLLNIIR